MDVILGIDTGGTYTDGVLMEYETKRVIRAAKAFTTKENLIIGIGHCLNKLEIREEEHVCLVCLSTTLATNAVVENRGARVGLITIGVGEDDRQYPAQVIRNVRGKIDIMGREEIPLSETEIRKVLEEIKPGIDALAISGYASIKNPEQEQYVKMLAAELTDLPVVCAHELTTTLGFYERTVTAVLNARLMPVISELMHHTKQSMKERGICAPIVVVKGDGHAMINGYAEECPVETVLSGPAASLVGGKMLAGIDDAIIVDIGGTTTDIVCIDQGEAVMDREGMSIGGWLTRVNAVRVHTFGLGGDSYLRINEKKNIFFGPRRVVPLCVAAADAPYLKEELRKYRIMEPYVILGRQETDCFRLFKPRTLTEDALSEKQIRVLELLQDGPHTALYLGQMMGTDIDSLDVEPLIEMELIQTISMTPTDLLHVQGVFTRWDREASQLGADLISYRLGLSVDVFLKQAEDQFVSQICKGILESLCSVDGLVADEANLAAVQFFLNKILMPGEKDHFTCQLNLNRPLVGVGASAGVWIRKAAKQLNAEFILPKFSETANAVGAAAGDVKETLEAMICFDSCLNCYTAYLPKERIMFSSLHEAKKAANQALMKEAITVSARLGLDEHDIHIDENDFYFENICTQTENYMKTVLRAVITGTVKVECE